MEIIIISVVTAILTAIVVVVVIRQILPRLVEKSAQMVRDESKEIIEGERRLIDEKLSRNRDDLKSKQDSISQLIAELRREINDSRKKLETAEIDRLASFEQLKTSLEEYKEITGDIKESADNLKNLLSNNQMRGKWGEEIAENLLKSVGFVSGQHYLYNTAQDTQSTRPDFTILLPNGSKVNVDVKFPFAALTRFQETAKKEEDWKVCLKELEKDVKDKIKQCSTRDYINPEENTVDFVILFVPNEKVFSVIYDNLSTVWEDGMKKKVILAGPFSFTAILRMIFQAYKNFSYQENLHQIIKLIREFEGQFEKFSDQIDGFGNAIGTLNNKYQELSTTRTNQLTRVIDKIRSEERLLGSSEN